MYLLTFSGRLLSSDPNTGELSQLEFEQALASDQAVALDLQGEQTEIAYKSFLEATDLSWSREITDGPLAGHTVTSVAGGRAVHIMKGGAYLCAEPVHAGGAIRKDRRVASGWETFVCLSPDDVQLIRHISENDWVVGSSHEVISRRSVRLDRGFGLAMGQLSFDLRYNLPFHDMTLPFRLVLLRDGWRIEELFLYKPLALFTAFRSAEVLRQLYIAVDSLLRFGGFTGVVQIITDQDRNTVLANIPLLPPERLIIQECKAIDWVGFVASKYLMIDDQGIFSFQPVLFSDPDMVFDANLTRILAAVAASPRMAAPIEHESPLRTRISVGSDLIKEDGCDPYHASGFNAGTLAIPNLVDHLQTLLLIRRIIVNRSLIKGRAFHKWVDQEIANYVSFKFAHFDKQLMTPFVRYGFDGVEKEHDKAVGIVHFWPPRGSAGKRKTMEAYVDALTSQIVRTTLAG